MVKNLIRRWFSRAMRGGDAWAMLEVQQFENDGRIKMAFDYNDAFIAKIKSLGFDAGTDEECVQLFFVTSALRPEALVSGDDVVQPDAHPALSSQQNVLMQ